MFTTPDGETATEPAKDEDLKHVVVLVTPTIIDSAGNRVHPGDQPPPARSTVPTQLPR